MGRIPCAECRKRKHAMAVIRELEQAIARKDKQIFRLRDKVFDLEETVDHCRSTIKTLRGGLDDRP